MAHKVAGNLESGQLNLWSYYSPSGLFCIIYFIFAGVMGKGKLQHSEMSAVT